FVSGAALWQWRQQAKQDAIAAGIATAEVDWLLRECSELDGLALRLESFRQAPVVQLRRSLAELSGLWQQRVQERMPVQYLVGTAPWRHFSLVVSPAVLIPRPETELIIDLAAQLAEAYDPHPDSRTANVWADLGTGSGAIAIGLAEVFPQATIHAVDWSSAAVAIAQLNAQRCGVSDRIQFHQGSWFEPLAALGISLRGMVSNPPYIPSAIIGDLQPEVVRHEPHRALDGGDDGLDCIRQLVAQAPPYLQAGGLWLVELMAGQAAAVAALLRAQGDYDNIQIHRDLAGIERFVSARRAAPRL
ncbi:MAG TPA: peptide chain release factor N(5)-glutamine methyltransferase, partial [Chroococcidiopsis sp.]